MTPETDLPHFVMVGAMKCGITTLAAQLARQEGVFTTDPKEPNFFSDDDVHAQSEAWYRGLFAGVPPGDIRGEASTHYTKLPTYPHMLDRMAALLPDLRLIYMIREARTMADRSETLSTRLQDRFFADRKTRAACFPDPPALGFCYPFVPA